MLMILIFKIFHHVHLNMSAERCIHLMYTLREVNYIYFRFFNVHYESWDIVPHLTFIFEHN